MTPRAWEVLCPELPPGWSVRQRFPGWDFEVGSALMHDIDRRGSRDAAIEEAWEHFGITRRAYAESIAIAKVREAAEAKHGWVRITLDTYPDEVTVRIMGRPYSGCHMEHVGPDICTAALRAIEALGGNA